MPHESLHEETETRGKCLEFETRFVDTPKVSPQTLLPYAQSAIDAIGMGAVVAVGGKQSVDGSKKGLLVTLPIHLSHNLIAELETLAESNVPEYEDAIFYANIIRTKAKMAASYLEPIVHELGIMPRDMRALFSKSHRLVLVSGPRDRQEYYEKVVKKEIETLDEIHIGDASIEDA